MKPIKVDKDKSRAPRRRKRRIKMAQWSLKSNKMTACKIGHLLLLTFACHCALSLHQDQFAAANEQLDKDEYIFSGDPFLLNESALVMPDYSSLLDDDDPLVPPTGSLVLVSTEANQQQQQQQQQQQKSLNRRQVLLDEQGAPAAGGQLFESATFLVSPPPGALQQHQQPAASFADYDSYRSDRKPIVAPANGYLAAVSLAGDSSNFYQHARMPAHPFAEPLKSALSLKQVATSGDQASNEQTPMKIGPQFIKEPPSFIHYLNSSDLVIPCAASGNPTPTITWWHKSGQLEAGSLLNKRYVRYDNSLVISAFKPLDFEPDIHSTSYKCQASNSLGTIVSRDVVINAVMDQDYEASVADQFVTVDNDALFKCQLAPQTRDLYQVVGWLEDGQHLIPATGLWTQLAWAGRPDEPGGQAQAQRRRGHQPQRAIVLPDGQLYIQRAQLRDANKSYRCQVKNLLSGRTSLSSISGRLFVTDASESGAAPRIVDAPRPVSSGKLNEQLLLTCLAQGSPRPTVRWFRQAPGDSQPGDWLELAPAATNTTGLAEPSAGTKYLISSEANLLLLKSLQASDQRAKFKCLANNTYGAHQAETELRIELWPLNRLVEVEPKVEFINSGAYQPGGAGPLALRQSLVLNCTIRWSSQALLALEWLRDGRQMFSIALAQYALGSVPARIQEPSANSSAGSIFDDPNQELSLVEFQTSAPPFGTSFDETPVDAGLAMLAAGDELEQPPSLALDQFGEPPRSAPGADSRKHNNNNNFLLSSATLNKLASLAKLAEQEEEQQQVRKRRAWQSLRLATKDTLLYQLHLDSVRRADHGAYQCRARLARTTVHATGQLLLKDNPPQFVETFAGQLITRQQLAQQQSPATSLKCVASGSPLPEISWTLSGFPVPESSRFRVGDYVTRDGLIVSFVNISSVQAEDGGLYECSATNDVGQLRHAAWLNVTGPAHIRPMPNVSAIAGGSLAIMCPVGGWPIEQIGWFQNASKLPLNHRQKLFPNGTLLINELNEVTDSGQYSCQAKSSGSDSLALNHVQIKIKVPPVVEPFSFAKSLHRGQRYNIMCTVVRGDLPVSIHWFKDGRLLAPADQQPAHQVPLAQFEGQASEVQAAEPLAGRQAQQQAAPEAAGIVVKQLDPYSSTLTFASLQSHHRGQYSCEATNEAGRANQSSTLVIHVPPEWRIEPKDLSVTVGKTAVIDCQADGFPTARIEWRLSQDLFREPPSEFKPIISSLYMRVFENGSLIIYNTQRSDAGYYLCQANNGVGPGISRVIKLTVHVAAHFKTKIRTELVRRGQAARLKCESIGDLPIEINWLRDKMPLYANDEPRYSLTKTLLQDGIVSELNIGETDRSDSALFTCITQNQFGTDDTNIQLVVQGPPDPPMDIRIHEYEARSVKISWVPAYSGNSPISKYVIMYSPAHATGSLEHQHQHQHQVNDRQRQALLQLFTNVSVNGNESSYLLQGLTPLTEYQFYMLAVNSIGVSRLPNEPIKFRTDDEAPSAPPLFVKAQPVSSSSLRVRWRAPDRRAHFGAISGFYVGYKLHRAESEQAGDKKRAGGQAAPDSTFVYKTIDFNPTQLVAGAESASANATKPAAASGQIVEQECQLNSLKRGQKYLITVQPFNSRGAGPSSEPIIAETWRFDVPDPPSLRMVSRTTRSIHLAWRLVSSGTNNLLAPAGGQQSGARALRKAAPSANLKSARSSQLDRLDLGDPLAAPDSSASPTAHDPMNDDLAAGTDDGQYASEPILGFILVRRQMPGVGQPHQQQQTGAGLPPNDNQATVETRLPADHMTQIVDNLACGTRYQFTISALNSVGASAPSEPLVAKTEGSPPVAPDRSSLLSLNASSVVINLGAWHNGACQMRSFDILFKPSRSKKWTTLTNYQVSAAQQWGPVDSRSSFSSLGAQSSNSTGGHHSEANQLVQRATGYAGAPDDANRVAPGQASQPNGTIVLDDLAHSLNYDLKIVATNEAGSTEALYTFNTNGNSLTNLNRAELDHQWTGGEFQMNENANLAEVLALGQLGQLFPVLLLVLVVSLALSAGCITLARRRHGSGSSCSLSISSASRSNQSSSNYYSAAGANQHNQTGARAQPANPGLGQARCKLAADIGAPGEPDLASPSLSAATRLNTNTIRLGDIYGSAPRQQLAGDKSTYAYLQQHQNRPASPHNTDINSVLNGSEAEMCLGASALNIGAPVGGQAARHEDEHLGAKRAGAAEHQTAGYYVAPAMLLANKSPSLLNQLGHLGKSSTLPANCHQQIVQQLFQHQQSDGEPGGQQQAMLDSLVAANIFQQQEAPGSGPNYLQAALQASQLQAQQQQHQDSQAAGLSLVEQQMQQQVYATVKRGCPRPPRLCDYTIYQCPNSNSNSNPNPIQNHNHNHSHNQNPQQEQRPQAQLMRCCAAAAELQHQQQQAPAGQPTDQIFYHAHQAEAPPGCVAAAHPPAGDYQQLRPIN